MLAEVGVVEALLARHLAAYPRGELYPLFLRRKLHFGNDKALILAKELINLDGVARIVDIVAHLVYNCALGELQQLRSLLHINFPLPFVAREASVTRWALDGKPRATLANAHTHRTLARGDIALNKVHRVVGEVFILAHNQIFTLYLLCHYTNLVFRCKHRIPCRKLNWSLLKHLHEQFPSHKAYHMPHNWRTAPVIIEENEKLIQQFTTHVAKNICDKYNQPDLGTDIHYIFDPAYMHQEPAKNYAGYFHMQFFDGNDAEEQTLNNLHLQLQSFLQEGIELKRVTLLVRYTHEAINLAHFLISKGYNVQSSEGLQIGSHPAIQLLINLLKQDNTQLNTIDQAYIHQTYGQLTPEQTNSILQAQHLPLYEQVQTLINLLQLTQQEGVAPYLTAFQDLIYQFTQSRVADRKAFLEYWERKGKNKTIAASQTADTIRIMTIHSSKGLEFDIVFIPFFAWELTKERASDIIWCVPQTPPFNQLPLVAVHPSKKLLQSHFTNEYIQDKLAQTIDNLNLTYVAITRPKYRLYIYGQLNSRSAHSVGAEVFALYKDLLNDQLTYRKPAEGTPAPLPPLKPETTTTYPATYIAEPIRSRLTLRSRAEDDFAPDTPLATVDLGILMHLWLSYIRTWDDAEPTLAKLIRQGQVTDNQAQEMRQQLQKLQALIARENHHDWFSNQYTILSEQDIITPSGNMQRPDRVMISGNHAIVIDYKFGYEQPQSHLEQVRDYMLLLNQMGYTAEGHIIYVALNKIHSIK